MTTVDLEPLTVSIPLREDPPGVFRVGSSRVLLEYLADPEPFDRYLQDREQESGAVRRQLDGAGVVSRIGKQELLRRARAKELDS